MNVQGSLENYLIFLESGLMIPLQYKEKALKKTYKPFLM